MKFKFDTQKLAEALYCIVRDEMGGYMPDIAAGFRTRFFQIICPRLGMDAAETEKEALPILMKLAYDDIEHGGILPYGVTMKQTVLPVASSTTLEVDWVKKHGAPTDPEECPEFIMAAASMLAFSAFFANLVTGNPVSMESFTEICESWNETPLGKEWGEYSVLVMRQLVIYFNARSVQHLIQGTLPVLNRVFPPEDFKAFLADYCMTPEDVQKLIAQSEASPNGHEMTVH